MATEEENPLIKALPPESDYLTYLTIVEYNLTAENLPILHRVLQDEKLTTNIGWDLVHLLVPYLPGSEQCLQDVANLGNPREVILKVTESLRLIEYHEDENDDSETQIDHGDGKEVSDVHAMADASTYPLRTARTSDSAQGSQEARAVEIPPPLPLPVYQFAVLLSMLAILHRRIVTKYPSRFLSSTLQATLVSFSNVHAHREETMLAIFKMVKAVTGTQRPVLPARTGSSTVLAAEAITPSASATDPEAPPPVENTSEEISLQRRLIQAFLTHVVEVYIFGWKPYDGVPGMAWCSRLMEKLNPQRSIPHTKAFATRFAKEETLRQRVDSIGQLLTLAQDLQITDEQLLMGVVALDEDEAHEGGEDEPPSSAQDIPLSKVGSLLLLTARQVSRILHETPDSESSPFAIFPHHQELLMHVSALPMPESETIGTLPEPLLDAILALGLLCLDRDSIGEPATDEEFHEYLQVTSLISSNCPNPNIRAHAHYLTSAILHIQPDEQVRLDFIRDTLEHCPFENLRVSAVGWMKDETIDANVSSGGGEAAAEEGTSTFATPMPLNSVASFLFPSLHADLVTAPAQSAWMVFQTNLSFYLASLNFLYFLLCATHLHKLLGVADMWKNTDVAASFIQPLRDAHARFVQELGQGALSGEKSDAVDAEMALLQETIDRVTGAVSKLNHA